MAEQQRLSAMEHHRDTGKRVHLGVLADPPGGLRDRFLRHDLGLMPPALVRVLIDVAMITGEIAAAAYLKDVLAYVRRHAENSE